MEAKTKKALTVVDKSTKAMTKAATDARKIMVDLAILADESAEIAFDIEQKSGELAAIEEAIKVKEREANADLQIRIKENEEKVLDGLMANYGLAKIKKPDLESLYVKIKELETDSDELEKKAVSEAQQKLHAHYGAKLAEQKADHKVEMADLTANCKSLADKVAYLESSNANLAEMLNQERQARVDTAKNQSQPIINFTGGK